MTTSNAPIVGPEIVKSGTLALFLTASADGLSNGNWPLALITAVNADPTFNLNGAPASFGPRVWHDQAHDISQVAYRAQCGHVTSIPMSAGGHGYTAPAAEWNGDGGGSGHTVGTPALATGVTSYTITVPGSGMPDGGYHWQPGGSPAGFGAMAWLTVSGGMVISVEPLSGSPLSYGAYQTSPASFNSTYGNATIVCHVDNYISGIPVTNPGTGFTSLPTYTITDPTGSGAVAAPQMALSAGDVVTYTVVDNWLSTNLGSVLGATDAVIPNFVGVLEGPTGHVSGFRDQPTVKFGGEHAGGGNQTSFQNLYKNKMSAASPFTGNAVVLDANYLPVSWTPGGWIQCDWGGSAQGVQAFPFGVYTVVYDDPGVDTTTVALNTPDFTFIDQTQSGITITQRWLWNTGPYAAGRLYITSSSGKMHISMPWIFAPGNTIDRSNKYAIDDAFVANFTNSDGSGPAHFRAMTVIGGIGFNGMVDIDDLPSVDLFNGINIPLPNRVVYPVAARFLNTDPAKSSTGDNTYPWPASTKLYSNQPWANSGSDDFGNYLDMTAGPSGVSDNGDIIGGGACEFRTSMPHGLKTGQFPLLFGTSSKVIPLTGGNFTVPGGGENMVVWVTGPLTFFIGLGTGTVATAAEIPLVYPDVILVGGIPSSDHWFPYEHQAEVTKRWPGTNLWLNIAPTNSHALVTEIANRVIAHLGPTNGVIFELGDEHWNFGFPWIIGFIYMRTLSTFSQYAAPGQPFLTYATRGANIWENFGLGTPMNSLLSADLFAVFKAAWIAAGRDPSKLILTYGSWWTSADTFDAVHQAVIAFGLPQTNAVVTGAPYVTPTLSQPTKIAAYTDAGNVAISNPGNWPCDAINDFERHAMFYNQNWWTEWGSEFARLAGTSLRMSTYEGGVTQILDINQGGATACALGQVTQSSLVQEDCMNSPSWADFVYAWGLLVQRGNPLVANSGAVYASWLNLWGGGQFGGYNDWYIQQSPAMPAGLGLSNSFMTPQGGFNGSHTATGIYGYSQVNQGPGFAGLLAFNAAAARRREFIAIVGNLDPKAMSVPSIASFDDGSAPQTFDALPSSGGRFTANDGVQVSLTGIQNNASGASPRSKPVTFVAAPGQVTPTNPVNP